MINITNFEDVKHITSKEYLKGEEFASDMFDAKYSHLKANQEKETPAEVFWRISDGLSKFEKDSERDHYRNVWFSLLWEGWFRPGGSVIAGVGSPVKQSISNCTTVGLNGDSLEDIAATDYKIMKCAAYRQGLGIDGSKLRPRGAKVNNAAMFSTGVIPWMEKLVDNGKYVGQSGRMPALLVSLKDHHPDIFEFIEAKVKNGKFENANISVQISNKFMDAVENDLDWELYFDFKNEKYERISKTVKAKEIFELIAKTATASAEPGIQYIDLLRDGTISHQIYKATGDERFKVISSNACSEKPLANLNVCNLLSINHEKFSANPIEYTQELEEKIPYLVRLSDNVISYELDNNLTPLKEQEWIVRNTREIGMGITNIHGWLLKQNLQYASEDANKNIENFWKEYAYQVFKASIELGKEKGNAPAFDLIVDKNILMGSSFINNIVNEYFNNDISNVTNLRNLAFMSIAPSGSISNTFPEPVFSSGIEPVIAPWYWRKTRAVKKGVYTHYFVIPNKVKEYVLDKIDDDIDKKKLLDFPGSILDEDGEIGKELVNIIEKYIPKDLFSPAHLIDPIKKIDLMSRIYKWMDASISVTYNLANTSTPEDVYNIYLEAYKKGVRAVSVYVDGSREGVLIFEDPITNAKRFENKLKGFNCNPDSRPDSIMLNCAPKRPNELPCDIHFTSIKGVLWIVLIGLHNGQPFEVFCGKHDDLGVPKSCKNGIIKKEGQGQYKLIAENKVIKFEYSNITDALMTDNEKALTRMLSLSLRHGAPPQYVVQQLKKSGGDITSFSTAISRVLSKYVGSYTLKETEKTCPICGEVSLVFDEGCIKCISPGCTYSRCGG